MITVNKIKNLDKIAYDKILEKKLDINKPIIPLEEVHKGAFLSLAQSYLMNVENWEFSLDELKRLNGLTCFGKNELAEYKKRENFYSSNTSFFYIAYIPASPEETPDAMKEWFEKYKNYNDLETIIEAEMDMCSIHPFYNGNGRTGYFLIRAMMKSIGYKCALHLNIDKYVYDRFLDNVYAIQKSAGRGWGLAPVDYTAYKTFLLEVLKASYDELISALI